MVGRVLISASAACNPVRRNHKFRSGKWQTRQSIWGNFSINTHPPLMSFPPKYVDELAGVIYGYDLD